MDPLFVKRMKEMTGDEFVQYIESLDKPLFRGVRLSGLKQPIEKTHQRLNALDTPSPFAPNAYRTNASLGLNPAHVQGLIYLQEPSAMSAVEVLNPSPNDVVLDLCAAPGSKSTQIVQKLKDGFLLSNEIDPKRAQALLSNMERMGAENFMVTNNDSQTLSKSLGEVFDKILVDAPCSGEGMMKKHEAAMNEWSLPNVLLCSARQKDILKEAWKMLKPGGQLVYSTCTYAKEENEQNVAWVLEQFEDARQLPIDVSWGRPGLETPGMDASKVRRIFPMDGGEGHFIARFEKVAADEQQVPSKKSIWIDRSDALPESARTFIEAQTEKPFSYYRVANGKVYGMNHPFMNLKKAKILRQGVLIGEPVKNRFEPEYAFFMSQNMAHFSRTKTETTLEQMDEYFHGQQLSISAPSGYRMLCYQGIPYGFGKSSQSRITNKLPKGLRLAPDSHIKEVNEDEHQ